MARGYDTGQLPDEAVASDLSTVSPQYKVHIPKECLSRAGWSSFGDEPLPLIAELLEFGRIRLHLESDLQPKFDSLRAAIVHAAEAGMSDQLGALSDRYRSVTFYAKEKTVLLKAVVAVYLGLTKDGDRQVFVEGRARLIDIMSLDYRNRRLDLHRDDLSV